MKRLTRYVAFLDVLGFAERVKRGSKAFHPAVVLAVALAACGPSRFETVRQPLLPAVEIRQLHLQWSNVFLVRDARSAILVDTGSPGDWDGLSAALHAAGVELRQLKLVVLTHAHADHAGLAARLLHQHVPVAVGAGDVAMAQRGHDDPLRPTGLFAALLRPLFDFSYERFTPPVVVSAPLTLDAYGLPDVRVEPMPGHTAGSLVVWVGARDAIVGDQMLGGVGAIIAPDVAGEHFYQADRHANYCNVNRLLAAGVQRFYGGHGGPFDRATVLGWRRDWEGEAARCEYEGLPFPRP